MQRQFLKILAVVTLANWAAYGQSLSGQASAGQVGQASSRQVSSGQSSSGQSLGDIARALREKQNSSQPAASAPSKVITNQDLGEGPEGRPDLRVAPRPVSLERGSGLQPGQQRGGDARAEQWRGQILEQKNRVAALQSRIDQISVSLHSGAPLAYNRNQAFQADRLAEMQMHLDEQKRRLNEMQEAARRAGMHTQVVDP